MNKSRIYTGIKTNMYITGAGINKVKRAGNERGATVVEFAVIVIPLFLIVFAILEFSFIFYQRHFVENAAREGMRVGIRANNFSCFDGKPAAGCTADVDRKLEVEKRVTDYLAKLYQPADIYPPDVQRDPEKPLIKVTATVDNFFPQLLSGLIPGFANQGTLSYSITGEYEDPDEYDDEEK
ncbi:MAG: pilus assembly protein [Desulfurivibrionaceae bacterium]